MRLGTTRAATTAAAPRRNEQVQARTHQDQQYAAETPDHQARHAQSASEGRQGLKQALDNRRQAQEQRRFMINSGLKITDE